ncbi:hypothetical protein PO124_11760 [Bacillus licheniformis]|nr:hypothetical protein [Bacillus licheniformis]
MREGDETYLLDTGFGINLPLAPVPFSGEPVPSKQELTVSGKQRRIKEITFLKWIREMGGRSAMHFADANR